MTSKNIIFDYAFLNIVIGQVDAFPTQIEGFHTYWMILQSILS